MDNNPSLEQRAIKAFLDNPKFKQLVTRTAESLGVARDYAVAALFYLIAGEDWAEAHFAFAKDKSVFSQIYEQLHAYNSREQLDLPKEEARYS